MTANPAINAPTNEAANIPGDKKPRKAALHVLSAIALVFALLSLLLFCAGAMSVPTFTKVFEDFDTELPGMTLLFLSVPPLGFVAIGLLGVPLLLKEWFVPSALVKLAINVLVVCFASLAFGAMVLALFLPLVSLMAEISATP